MHTDTAETLTYTIEWDLGDYPGFATYDEARSFQREHRMTGSSITAEISSAPA